MTPSSSARATSPTCRCRLLSRPACWRATPWPQCRREAASTRARRARATAPTTPRMINTTITPPARAVFFPGRFAIEPMVERFDQATDPRHRMADRAQQLFRVTETEFEQHGDECKCDRHDFLPTAQTSRCGMAATSASPGACSRARLNLSSTCRPGSIPFLPLPRLSSGLFARLPDTAAAALARRRAAYGALSAAHVCLRRGRRFCCLLSPVWSRRTNRGSGADLSRHPRAAMPAGHVTGWSPAPSVMPHWPSWQIPTIPTAGLPRRRLLALAKELRRRGGLLVVDEASWKWGRPGRALRGKYRAATRFGALIRQVFRARRIEARLCARGAGARLQLRGFRAVAGSGPALAVGAERTRDPAWTEKSRRRIAKAAMRLDATLTGAGLEIVGGTTLFRLAQTPAATALFRHLGRAGILVRAFPDDAIWLRFGLPANGRESQRLQNAMAAFPAKAARLSFAERAIQAAKCKEVVGAAKRPDRL